MNSNQVENSRNDKNTTKSLIIKNLFSIDFILSVIVPIAIYYIFSIYKLEVTGTIITGLWCLGVIAVQFIITKRLNVYALIAAVLSAIGLIGTVISNDPKFFLASPIVSDILLAIVFFVSIFIGKPLLEVLAEYSMKSKFSEDVKKRPGYKSAWIILTVAWGILSLTQALLRIILLYSASNEVYFAVSTAYGNISTPLLLVFSFWFPGWYWRRKSS